MHELSLAEAMVDAVLEARPAGATVRVVTLRAGPMRGIDNEAMTWAWQAATTETELAGSRLELQKLPWRLKCPKCGKEFESQELYIACTCGEEGAYPLGGDELQIVSMEIETP